MQHKRGHSRSGIFLALLIVMLGVGVGALMVVDVPAPQKPVEKQLDAAAFLGQKQP